MSKQFYKEELGNMIAENGKLKQQVLDLTMEVAELKDELRQHSCYAETDGYEVGSPSDYEDNGQLELFNVYLKFLKCNLIDFNGQLQQRSVSETKE